ncbi:MAG: hypothetical protein DU429_08855 [Candidatus Tokpelaia sp.]|uniref:hypothetical protein n=1 Tax=Candidatus Tokpelaia sp. TaxID=2233777 RepID=UPI00123B9D61|nr:hypothetical protein [Candidatus Tokpelaia sp.]KAA6204900.1 MAG: hypothetical protein DU429_08855 [Candidatus Tokpelaia sp.]KAA6206596.1 MAG: hypothetical protein DU430_00465 [Candidatus Tokpelaia sp.]KAA6405894.1 hypothetical protein DPQ22_02730 [Candidatus Tokpelaia sp.]
MRFDEAASVLKKIYEEMAQRKEAGQAALLFGLYCAEEIKAMNYKNFVTRLVFLRVTQQK